MSRGPSAKPHPRFGAWLDPAADKLLMILCLLALLHMGKAPLWLVLRWRCVA